MPSWPDVFPEGTNGVQLDAIARQPLWQYGFDYGHGMGGHGVGHILGVHEGPASISKRGTKPIKAGYILSNEPGYYKAGSFGIRQENLVKIVQAKTGYLGMESLTLCPFDRDLIDISLFTDDQRDWLNSYHRRLQIHWHRILMIRSGSGCQNRRLACNNS